MVINKYSIALAISAMLLISCEKKELPAPKYNRGDVITQQIDMSNNYKTQIWFQLSTNSIVFTNNKTDWDLGFESSALGFHVILNSSKAMKAYKTNYSNLSQVTDTSGLGNNGLADMPTGNLDSCAIGNWQNNNAVYVINRGYNELGQQQGFYKLKITSVSASQYSFEYADIYGTTSHQGTLNKNTDYTFNMFSFASNQQVIIEPKKSEYDLCFTQYSHVYYDPPPLHFYQVTGALSNSYNTRVLKITDKPFNTIVIGDTLNKTFSSSANAIGFDWKFFDLNTNIYTVDASICYIIQDNKGFYYKLHFIDFYNSSGIKGYPKFEFIKL